MSGTDVDRCLYFGAKKGCVVLMSYYWQKPVADSSQPGNGKWHQTERSLSLSAGEFNLAVSLEQPVEMSLSGLSYLRERGILGWFGEIFAGIIQTLAIWDFE